jgi:hypothetical protein
LGEVLHPARADDPPMTRLRLLAATVGVLFAVITAGFALTGGGPKTAVPAVVVVLAVIAFVLGGPRSPAPRPPGSRRG